jgi:GNAT superfamily N-acetyltransferase
MLDLAKAALKKLARILVGDYAAYYIYASPDQGYGAPSTAERPDLRVAEVDVGTIQSCAEPLIRAQAHYLGPGAHAYACLLDEGIAAVCIYWFGERYRTRNFWPLREDEAKLVQVVTLPEMRGRGVATILIASSCRAMLERGFHRAYARIWHSNAPSLRAFDRAGWRRLALVLEVNPLRWPRPIRLRVPARRLTTSNA